MNMPDATPVDIEFFETFNYMGVNFDGASYGWLLWEVSLCVKKYTQTEKIPKLIQYIDNNTCLPLSLDREIFKRERVYRFETMLEYIPKDEEGNKYKKDEISDTVDQKAVNFKDTYFNTRPDIKTASEYKFDQREYLWQENIWRNETVHEDDVRELRALMQDQERYLEGITLEDFVAPVPGPAIEVELPTTRLSTIVTDVPEAEEQDFQKYLDSMELEYSLQTKKSFIFTMSTLFLRDDYHPEPVL
jgi:hypothetical protein